MADQLHIEFMDAPNNNAVVFGASGTSEFIAQTFQPTADITCTAAEWVLAEGGTPVDNTVVRVETLNSGTPSGTLVNAGAVATVDSNSFGGFVNVETNRFKFTFDSSFALGSGVDYALVIGRDGSRSTTNRVDELVLTTGGYANGEIWRKDSGTWSDVSGTFGDALFSIFEEIPPIASELSDTVALSESQDRVVDFPRTLSNTLALSDTLNGAVTRVRTLDDALAISETQDVALVMLVTLSETMGITESIDVVSALARGIEDSMAISETLVRTTTLSRSLADTLGLTESVTFTELILALLQDSVGLTDDLRYALLTTDSPNIQIIVIDNEIDDPPQIGEITEGGDIVKMDSVE